MEHIKLITAVDRVEIENLWGFMLIDSGVVSLSRGIEWEPIPIKVPASLSITDKIEDRERIYTASLKFLTCEGHLEDNLHYAYRVTIQDGSQMLIGSDQRPYPIINLNENHPENPTDNQLNEYTVSLISPKKVPYILK